MKQCVLCKKKGPFKVPLRRLSDKQVNTLNNAKKSVQFSSQDFICSSCRLSLTKTVISVENIAATSSSSSILQSQPVHNIENFESTVEVVTIDDSRKEDSVASKAMLEDSVRTFDDSEATEKTLEESACTFDDTDDENHSNDKLELLHKLQSILGLPLTKARDIRSFAGKQQIFVQLCESVAETAFGLKFEELHALESCPFALAMKDGFQNTEAKDQVRLLTLVPYSDTQFISTYVNFFGCSRPMFERARKIVEKNGIYGQDIAETRGRSSLPEASVDLVKKFYLKESIVRELPGMKDTVSVKVNGKREKRQKKLLTLTINEIFAEFKKEYPTVEISLSKFFQLRPAECVSPNSSGVHNVCVCVYHQNIKLMSLVFDQREANFIWKNHLKDSMCEEPTVDCFFNRCASCPDVDELSQKFKSLLPSLTDNEYVSYQAWTNTDRATIEKIDQMFPDFVQKYATQMLALKTHDFITKKQFEHLNYLKNNLAPGELIILMDFSENYKHIIQDSAQSFYFNAPSTTIFTAVVYYFLDNEIKYESFVFVSEYMKHDTVFTYCCQRELIKYFKGKHPVKEVQFFTDGASAHFKNKKNMANLIHFYDDFGVRATWNFHSTGMIL